MDRRHLVRDAGLLALTVTTLIVFCFLVAVLLTVLVHFLQHQARDDLSATAGDQATVATP